MLARISLPDAIELPRFRIKRYAALIFDCRIEVPTHLYFTMPLFHITALITFFRLLLYCHCHYACQDISLIYIPVAWCSLLCLLSRQYSYDDAFQDAAILYDFLRYCASYYCLFSCLLQFKPLLPFKAQHASLKFVYSLSALLRCCLSAFISIPTITYFFMALHISPMSFTHMLLAYT